LKKNRGCKLSAITSRAHTDVHEAIFSFCLLKVYCAKAAVPLQDAEEIANQGLETKKIKTDESRSQVR